MSGPGCVVSDCSLKGHGTWGVILCGYTLLCDERIYIYFECACVPLNAAFGQIQSISDELSFASLTLLRHRRPLRVDTM